MAKQTTIGAGPKSNTGRLAVQAVSVFQGAIVTVGSPHIIDDGGTFDTHVSHATGDAFLVFELPRDEGAEIRTRAAAIAATTATQQPEVPADIVINPDKSKQNARKR